MAIYGLTPFGFRPPDGWYGYGFGPGQSVKVEPVFRIEPFAAVSRDYQTIQVTWTKPAASLTQGISAYRLIKNRYGYPSDQDDGEILIDSLTYPGNYFLDTQVVPGQYHYYGFYIQLAATNNVWIRSGLTACLANMDFGVQDWLLEKIPAFFTSNDFAEDELGPDVTNNPVVDSFTQVIAWGLNYLKTQYNTYTQINNPWFVPLDDLWNLAVQLGLNINPDISAYTLRKAVFFNAVINEQRGTLGGIETEVSALTGWNSDLRVGRNMMLENDQSEFISPDYADWSSGTSYVLGERVEFGNYIYQCILANQGNIPTGSNSSNTWWQPCAPISITATLLNNNTAGQNTWESVYTGPPSLPAQPLLEQVGLQNPLVPTNFQTNGLEAVNNTTSTANVELRSISRVNLNPNFNFSSSVGGWGQSGGGTFTYVTSLPGSPPPGITTAGELVTTTSGMILNGTSFPAVANAAYHESTWVYSSVSSVNLGIQWTTSSGMTNTQSTISVTANTWTQITTSQTAPSNASAGQMYIDSTTGTQTIYAAFATVYQATQGTVFPYAPDAAQVVGDGIPVPYSLPYQAWNATTRYLPNQIVTYSNQPFICNWANTGITPPYNSIGTNNFEWAPLSFSDRYRICVSAYANSSMSSVNVVPFVEWYDQFGNPIQRVVARNASNGINGTPPSLFYDSFTAGNNNPLSGRTTDDGNGTWTQQTGIYSLTPQGAGAIYPLNLNQRCIATVNAGVSNTSLGITFVSAPVNPQSQGLLLRYVNNTSYLRADMTGLTMNNGGTKTVLGTYSIAAVPGDRLTVNLNGVVITCYVNGQQVLQMSTSFNQTATIFGIITEIS